MGIDKHNSPSLLIGRVFAVGPDTVPRVAEEVEAERKASLNRTQYMRRVEEVQGLTWHERRRLEIERMKKRRTGDGAAS